MKIKLIKEQRKTIALKVVDSENAILKAPKSISDKKIEEFLKSKANWLNRVTKRMKETEQFSTAFDFEKFIYLDGKQFISTNEISIGFEKLSAKNKWEEIKKYYLSLFWKLEELADKLSKETGLKFKEIKSSNSVRVWGSYNSKGQMKLNFKLLVLPERLIRYVIYHELCHSIHMNHKPQFWKDLEKLCPNYKALKKELSQFSFVLKTAF